MSTNIKTWQELKLVAEWLAKMQRDGIDPGETAMLNEIAAPQAQQGEAKAPAPATNACSLSEDESDPIVLWSEIHRLRSEAKGPDGFATWKDAAVAERVRRVKSAPATLSDWQVFDLLVQSGRADKLGFREPGTSRSHKVDVAILEKADVAKFMSLLATAGSSQGQEDAAYEAMDAAAKLCRRISSYFAGADVCGWAEVHSKLIAAIAAREK